MANNKLGAVIILLASIGLVACGGGSGGNPSKTLPSSSSSSSSVSSASLQPESSSSSSSSSVAVSSSSVAVSSSSSEEQSSSAASVVDTYTYDVSIASTAFNSSRLSFSLFAKAHAAAYFSPDRFVLVRVDTSGRVIETVPLAAGDIEELEYDRFAITVPIQPRLDYVLLVLYESMDVPSLGDSIFGGSFLTAPLTASAFRVDPAVTAAYQAFLENLPVSFDERNSTDKSSLSAFNDVADVIRDRSKNIYATNNRERVAAIINEQGAVAATLAANMYTPTSVNLESMLYVSSLNWFMAEDDGEFTHGAYRPTYEQYIYRGTSSGMEWEDYMSEQVYGLTDAGWELMPSSMGINSFSADGTSMYLNSIGESTIHIQPRFTYNFFNESLATVLAQVPVFNNLRQYVNESASGVIMGEDDIFIVADAQATTDIYEMWFNDEVDQAGNCINNSGASLAELNGNCDTVTGLVAVENFPDYLTYKSNVESLDYVISNNASALADQIFIVVDWAENDHLLLVSLRENGKAEYYDYQQQPTPMDESTSMERLNPIASGTWVKNSHASGVELLEFTVPQAALNMGYGDDKNRFITLHNGYVRFGSKTLEGDMVARNMLFTSGWFANKFLDHLELIVE